MEHQDLLQQCYGVLGFDSPVPSPSRSSTKQSTKMSPATVATSQSTTMTSVSIPFPGSVAASLSTEEKTREEGPCCRAPPPKSLLGIAPRDDQESDSSSTTSSEAVADGSQPTSKQTQVLAPLEEVKFETPPLAPKERGGARLFDEYTSRTRYEQAEDKVKKLEEQLKDTHGLAKDLFVNLRHSRVLYKEMERREQLRDAVDEVDMLLQQTMVLRLAMFLAPLLLLTGNFELFLAVMGFAWLTMEIATTV